MFSRIKRIYREYKELRYLAYHDSLTKLLNRNWLYKNINNLAMYNYVYFLDINNLRMVNKSGHTKGDEYIVNIVRNINNKLTKKDIFIRYAGDEFIIISNKNNVLNNNCLYTVGKSKLTNNILESIKNADMNMIRSKNKLNNSFNNQIF